MGGDGKRSRSPAASKIRMDISPGSRLSLPRYVAQVGLPILSLMGEAQHVYRLAVGIVVGGVEHT